MGLVQRQAEEKQRSMVDSRFPDQVLKVAHRRINCPYCGRLICEGRIITIRVKCPSCKLFSIIRQL